MTTILITKYQTTVHQWRFHPQKSFWGAEKWIWWICWVKCLDQWQSLPDYSPLKFINTTVFSAKWWSMGLTQRQKLRRDLCQQYGGTSALACGFQVKQKWMVLWSLAIINIIISTYCLLQWFPYQNVKWNVMNVILGHNSALYKNSLQIVNYETLYSCSYIFFL